MKLSEAISLGAMLTPQAIGHFVDTNGGHCAWASASEAVGGTTTSIMRDEWKWTKRMVNCPMCKGTAPVPYAIIHLNDRHRWTRQRIAEWVSTIEPTEDTSREGEEFSSVA